MCQSLVHVRDIKVWKHLTQHHQAILPSDFELCRLVNPGIEDVVAAALRMHHAWDDGDDLSSAAYSAARYGYSMASLEPLIASSGVPLSNILYLAGTRGHTHLLLPLLGLDPDPYTRADDGARMYQLFECRDPCKIPRTYRALLPLCEGVLDVRYLLAACLKTMGQGWQCWSADSGDTPESNPAMDLLRDIIGRIVGGKREDADAIMAKGLLTAARCGAPLSALKMLLEEGKADVNAGRTKKMGRTVLMLVAKKGRSVEVLRQLLKAGADPDIRDNGKWDALTLAIRKRHHHLAEILFPLTQRK